VTEYHSEYREAKEQKRLAPVPVSRILYCLHRWVQINDSENLFKCNKISSTRPLCVDDFVCKYSLDDNKIVVVVVSNFCVGIDI
jgi:hypothetical protein